MAARRRLVWPAVASIGWEGERGHSSSKLGLIFVDTSVNGHCPEPFLATRTSGFAASGCEWLGVAKPLDRHLVAIREPPPTDALGLAATGHDGKLAILHAIANLSKLKLRPRLFAA